MAAFASFGIFLVALLVLMATRTPVAVALAMVTVAGTAVFVSPAALSQLASAAYALSSNFILVVVPMFILMGEVLSATGIGAALFRAAELWFRRPAGSPGDRHGVGLRRVRVGLRLQSGHRKHHRRHGGPANAAPRLPQFPGARRDRRRRHPGHPDPAQHLHDRVRRDHRHLDRPSVHGRHRSGHHARHPDVDDHRGHRAGRPTWAPPITEQPTRAEKWIALGAVTPVLILTVTVIGSIYSGAATPTEAGAVGAAGALVIALFMRRLSLSILWISLQKTIRTTAMFLLLLTGGIFSSYLMARLGIPQAVSDFMTSLPLPPWAIMVIINLTLLVLGTFMDSGSMIVIVIPIFLKTIIGLGYDPVWFGIVVDIQSKSPRSRRQSDLICLY